MRHLRLSLIIIATFFITLLLVPTQAMAQTKNVCLDCHSNMDAPLKVTLEEFSANVHAQKGFSCDACHGGDTQNEDRAMAPAAGFRGNIKRERIPELCGSCHGDANRMRQYNPSLRTDQLAQYRSSVHGRKLAAGDTHVAVCTDCHSVHAIRPASDPRSTVHPLNVAETCKRCHGDANYMKPYRIATDQFAGYSVSVHHEAMTVRGDLSAPTCTTCHGNHGATPPGVTAIANVCSTCHVFQAKLFEESPHKKAFGDAGMPACVTCHSNHGIKHPDDKLVGTTSEAVCTNCHAEGDAGFKTAAAIHDRLRNLEQQIASARAVLDRATRSGMEVAQPQLDLAQATDALMKARVAVHSFDLRNVDQEAKTGGAIAAKAHAAADAALRERNFRRKGLLLSVFAIMAVVLALGAFVREMERDKQN